MKKKLVIANWKMNPATLVEAKALFSGIKKSVAKQTKSSVVICPPVLFLSISPKGMVLGIQDVSEYKGTGSHTGEISATQAKSMGIQYAIVGHSERRAKGETNGIVALKARNTLDAKIRPVICIGEKERDSKGVYLEFLKIQIRESLDIVSKNELKNVCIAYEPLWAIGKTAEEAMTPEDLHEMSIFIRKVLSKKYDRKAAYQVKLLYGGSVESTNASLLWQTGVIDGFLVGHASLDPEQFKSILNA